MERSAGYGRASRASSLDLPGLLALSALWGTSYLFIKVAVAEVPALTLVAVVTYIIPIVGLFLGWLVLGEPLESNVLVGLVLILFGVLLVRSR